mmetsp:Transcript_15041/g.39034  ORF Transcript_15041/g.39034 Transcript_15041/m.39034 type:complete len:524 (-) Transcript_15041:351-1922(-)
MTPEMIAQAQQMMSKMSPEEIQRMQEMSRNMDPAQMRAMQQQMMSNPAMMAQAQAQMANMTPEQLRQQMEVATQQMKASGVGAAAPVPKGTADTLRASARGIPPGVISMVEEAEKFKEAGNKRFKAADYDGAIAKYDAALGTLRDCKYESELTGADLTAVHTLADACLLNGANCHLKKKTYDGAIENCDTVLSRSATNRKALYRRGQAYLAQGKLAEAVTDLKAAHAQDRSDAVVAGTLREARAKLKQAGGAEVEGIEDVDDDTDDDMPGLERVNPSGAGGGSASTPASQMPMGMPPDMDMQAAIGNMTPDQIRAQMDMVANMDPEVLKKLDPRMKDMDPAMIKASLEAAKSMTPEQMQQMHDMARAGKLPTGGLGGGMGGAGAAAGMGGMPGMPGGAPNMESMMQNMSPEMLTSATEMMRSMSPEQMAKMMSSMGKEVTPEQAKQMQDQLNKVSPETMQLWTGRMMRAYKGWLWLKSGAAAWFSDPRRTAASLVRASGIEQLTATLVAVLALLIVGHFTSLY